MNSWFENIIRLLAVVFLQVLLVNNLHFLGIVNPCIYILFLLALPASVGKLWQLLIGFGVGLVIDVFTNSPGVHTASCTALMLLRPYLLSWMVQEEERLVGTLNANSLTWGVYIRYVAEMTLVHHTLVFALQAFTWHAAWLTLIQIVVSSLVTISLLLFWEAVNNR